MTSFQRALLRLEVLRTLIADKHPADKIVAKAEELVAFVLDEDEPAERPDTVSFDRNRTDSDRVVLYANSFSRGQGVAGLRIKGFDFELTIAELRMLRRDTNWAINRIEQHS